MTVDDPRAHAEGRRNSAVARAVVFGSVLAVSWWFWSSAASADEAAPADDDVDNVIAEVAAAVAPQSEAAPVTAAAAPAAAPAPGLATSVLPTAPTPPTVAAPASEPVTQALTQTVKSVEATVDGVVSPVVGPVVQQVVAPILDPVVHAVAVPVVRTVVDDVVSPVVTPVLASADILPTTQIAEPSAPAAPTVAPPALPTALVAGLDAAAGPGPTGARRSLGEHDATATDAAFASTDTFSGSAALGDAAPSQQDLPGPRRATGTPGATGPSVPASAGGRDLPDRTQNVVAHSAAAHAHSAVMALRAPGAPRVAGASVNSGSRPSVTPD